MTRDKRGQRRRFIYAKPPKESVVLKMPIERAPHDHPLLKPGQCRVEGGRILVREYRTVCDLDFWPLRSDHEPTAEAWCRLLTKFAVDIGYAFREGVAFAIRHRMTDGREL